MAVPFRAVALVAGLMLPAADRVPTLAVEATCRAAAKADPANVGGGELCLRSERAALADLVKRWSEFDAASRVRCREQATMGGFPSYVELITCLEVATGRFKRPEGAPPPPSAPAPRSGPERAPAAADTGTAPPRRD